MDSQSDIPQNVSALKTTSKSIILKSNLIKQMKLKGDGVCSRVFQTEKHISDIMNLKLEPMKLILLIIQLIPIILCLYTLRSGLGYIVMQGLLLQS